MNTHPLPDKLLGLLLLGLLLLMPLLSADFGITWDEPDHVQYGQEVLNYYTNGFEHPPEGYHALNEYNGALFDLLATLAQKSFSSLESYTVRHAMNSLFGWLALLFAGLTARRLFGSWAGVAAVVILAAAPRFMGHSMNNPKDIPFAALYMLGLYCLTFIGARYPFAGWRTMALIGVGIALSLNVRTGGLLLLCYLWGVLAFRYAMSEERTAPKTLGRAALMGVLGTALFFTVGVLFWPWAHPNPLIRALDGLAVASNYPWQGSVLFGGEIVKATQLPWTYIPTMLWLCMPVVLWLGAGLSLALLRDARFRIPVAGLIVAALFPPVYAMVKGSVVYDGMRHFLFVIPPLAVLAGAGWTYILQATSKRGVQAAAGLVFLALLALPVQFQILQHPNQITYFNYVSGGIGSAFEQYELDYWGNCVKQSIDWMHVTAEEQGREVVFRPVQPLVASAIYAGRYRNLQLTKGDDYDYTAFTLRFPPETLHRLVQDPLAVHAVTVEDVPVCMTFTRGQ